MRGPAARHRRRSHGSRAGTRSPPHRRRRSGFRPAPARRSSGAARSAAGTPERAVSQSAGRSQGIVRRASSPQSPSSPSSSPANTIGTPGVVICSPIPTTSVARAGHRLEARRVVAVEQRPGVQHRGPGQAGAERAHRRDCLRAADPPQPGGHAPERVPELAGEVVAAQPRPHRAQEARVVHRAMPATAVEVPGRRRARARRPGARQDGPHATAAAMSLATPCVGTRRRRAGRSC